MPSATKLPATATCNGGLKNLALGKLRIPLLKYAYRPFSRELCDASSTLTAIVSNRVARSGGVRESVAITSKVVVPAALGVPKIVPSPRMDSPGGKSPCAFHDTGAVPPLDRRASANGTRSVPLGSPVVAIVSG